MTESSEHDLKPGVERKVWDVEGEPGEKFNVSYYKLDKIVNETDEKIIPKTVLNDVYYTALKAFPHWDEDATDYFWHTFMNTKTFITINNADNECVGFSVFKNENLGDRKVTYFQYSGIDPKQEGRGLMEKAREKLLEIEKPEIFAGRTANPSIYVSSKKIAGRLGYDFYPTEDSVPDTVNQLGREVLTLCSGETAAEKMERNLVISRKSQASKGRGSFELFDKLFTEPNQQVLYLAVKPENVDLENV